MSPRLFRLRPGRVVCIGLLVLSGLVMSVPQASAAAPKRFLLALGDSLAAGYQPTDGQHLPPIDPATGYRDQGYPRGYAADLASARGLKLVDLGCPGETTSSMVATPAMSACATLYREEFGATSQLAAAKAFLASHRDAVALVTLDIGANDLDRCASSSALDYRCFVQASQRVEAGRTTIIARLASLLRQEDPGSHFVTMNYYDPFLGLAERPGGVNGLKDATESLVAVNAFNRAIGGNASSLHVGMADVASAFAVDSLLPVGSYAGQRLPHDVVETCDLTWMCIQQRGSSPDIHPNNAGYRVIAAAFERVLPSR